jgi:hypothetical protein
MTEERGSWTKSKWLWIPFSLVLIVALVLVGAIAGRGGIASQPAGEEPSQIPIPEQEDLVPAKEATVPSGEADAAESGSPKLESSLNQLLAARSAGGFAEAQAFATSRGIILSDGQVLVEITADADEMQALKEAVEAAGGEYRGHYESLMEALVPIGELASLAARPEVQLIRPPQQAIPAISQ